MNLVTDITAQRRLETELERYAKVAAHDLREPLLAITLFVEQLRRGLDEGRDERNEQLVSQLRQTATRPKSLVDGILEYARHGTEVAFEPVDIGALAAEVLHSLASALDDAAATVEVGELPTVRGNRGQLETGAAEPGREQPQVPCRGAATRQRSPPSAPTASGSSALNDNGVGIPPELGDEAFAMFKRAHGEETEGSGIGSRGLPQGRRGPRRSDQRGARRRRRHRRPLQPPRRGGGRRRHVTARATLRRPRSG